MQKSRGTDMLSLPKWPKTSITATQKTIHGSSTRQGTEIFSSSDVVQCLRNYWVLHEVNVGETAQVRDRLRMRTHR